MGAHTPGEKFGLVPFQHLAQKTSEIWGTRIVFRCQMARSDTLTFYTRVFSLGAPLTFLRYLAVLSLLFAQSIFARAETLGELNDSFWQWRAQEQPFTDDDIPRIERPAGLVVDWSPQTIAQRLQQLNLFEQRWKGLAPRAQASIHDQVDYRLLGSALARVRWELSIEETWKR